MPSLFGNVAFDDTETEVSISEKEEEKERPVVSFPWFQFKLPSITKEEETDNTKLFRFEFDSLNIDSWVVKHWHEWTFIKF